KEIAGWAKADGRGRCFGNGAPAWPAELRPILTTHGEHAQGDCNRKENAKSHGDELLQDFRSAGDNIPDSTHAELKLQHRELLLEIVSHERLDNAIKVAINERRQIINGEFDAVIGHAVLREIVGADALVAFT